MYTCLWHHRCLYTSLFYSRTSLENTRRITTVSMNWFISFECPLAVYSLHVLWSILLWYSQPAPSPALDEQDTFASERGIGQSSVCLQRIMSQRNRTQDFCFLDLTSDNKKDSMENADILPEDVFHCLPGTRNREQKTKNVMQPIRP